MPYNTRSTTHRKHEEAGDVTVSPSATGKGTHIRWNYTNTNTPLLFATPELSNYQNSGSDSSFTSFPATPPNINGDNRNRSMEQKDIMSAFAARDMETARRGMIALQAHKTMTEEILQGWNNGGEEYSDDEVIEELLATDNQGRALPKGIKGLGPNGTFLISDTWHPSPSEDDPATTDQLPTIREDEGMDVGKKKGKHVEFVQGSSWGGTPSGGWGSIPTTIGGLPEFVSRSRRHHPL